jgi:dCMP deaminase
MASKASLDKLFMDFARRVAKQSVSRRSLVGAIVVDTDNNILSYGWNGTPSGEDNNCEIVNDDGTLTTKPEVLHAESNALSKLLKSGRGSTDGGTIYVSYSPCMECSKLILQAGLKRVVYEHEYRVTAGLDLLKRRGVQVQQFCEIEKD